MHSPLTRTEIANALLKHARAAVLFASDTGDLYASIPRGAFGHRVLPLRSHEFREWLLAAFIAEHDFVPSASVFRETFNVISAQARYSHADPQPVHSRLAARNGSLLLDLGNPGENEYIEITPQGWTLTTTASAFFHPANPLPRPNATPNCGAAALDALRDSLGLSHTAWNACHTWLLAGLQPSGPLPILHIAGPPGSGKSTLARLLQSILDRPGLTIVEGALDPSLKHLALSVELPELAQQRTQAAINAEFARLHPALIAGLCDSAVTALGRIEETIRQTYPRLADASAWVAAAGETLPAQVHIPCELERAVNKLLETRSEWTGTATELRDALAPGVPTPSILGHRVRNLAAFTVTTTREGGTGARYLHIGKPDGPIPKVITTSPSSLSQPHSPKPPRRYTEISRRVA